MPQPVKPFKLDAVLNYRKQLEDLARQRLFAAEKVKKNVENRLEEEQRAVSCLVRESGRLQAETISISLLIRYAERINFLQQGIEAIKKTLAEKEANVLAEQKNLARRAKERQVLENLKEHQNRNWKNSQSKKELAMLDEIAVIRHSRSPL